LDRPKNVPVSTIPAVVVKIEVSPYVMDWSIPQNLLAGEVLVTGLLSGEKGVEA
jgi:hypothetical protein